jgi:chromosome partitioning protein
MKTIAFMTQKGGSGKTTLAVHTGVAAANSKQKTLIVDTDYPQHSTAKWFSVRGAASPIVAQVQPEALKEVLETAKAEAVDLAIVDAGAHVHRGAVEIAMLADFILMPCRPSALDLAALTETIEIVRASGKPAGFVLNACPARALEIAEMEETLAACGFPVAPVKVGDRRAFARALASGSAVTEFEKNGKAAQEIKKLYQWVLKQL